MRGPLLSIQPNLGGGGKGSHVLTGEITSGNSKIHKAATVFLPFVLRGGYKRRTERKGGRDVLPHQEKKDRQGDRPSPEVLSGKGHRLVLERPLHLAKGGRGKKKGAQERLPPGLASISLEKGKEYRLLHPEKEQSLRMEKVNPPV